MVQVSVWSTRDKSDVFVNRERMLILNRSRMDTLTREVHLEIIRQRVRVFLLERVEDP